LKRFLTGVALTLILSLTLTLSQRERGSHALSINSLSPWERAGVRVTPIHSKNINK